MVTSYQTWSTNLVSDVPKYTLYYKKTVGGYGGAEVECFLLHKCGSMVCGFVCVLYGSLPPARCGL